MLLLYVLLQIAAEAPAVQADSVYESARLREFIARASVENRAPPLSLAGYNATVESELALILRDSLGRELVGQIEQLAARADWARDGRYDLRRSRLATTAASPPRGAVSLPTRS